MDHPWALGLLSDVGDTRPLALRPVDNPPAIPLSQASEGQRVRLLSLPSHPGLRQRLMALGLRPGSRLEVIRRGHPGGLLHLAHGVLEFMLRQEHAARMEVEPEEDLPRQAPHPRPPAKAPT